jgi:hypothetical protein
MKSVLVQTLTLYAIPTVFAAAIPLNSITHQKPVAQVEVITEPKGALKVPGHNNATYGPVPKASQLFEIEFFEIAPSTIPV